MNLLQVVKNQHIGSSPMQIEFINHASFLLKYRDIALICDPWIDGRAFHDGWALAAPTAFTYDRFEEVTHIWFSHEHPDHFSPGNLKKIPVELRKGITILFQHTRDKKVVNFCRSIGFEKIVELHPSWHSLTEELALLNVPHTDGDSWLCIKTENHTILNLNDCGLESDKELQKVKQLVGGAPIDVLFTQFSYANWSGNADEKDLRMEHAASKLREIARQVAVLKPTFTIPFASYIWFCHEENFYMNDAINRADIVHDYILNKTTSTPVVMFPGEVWSLGGQHASNVAVAAWLQAYENTVGSAHCISPVGLDYDALTAHGRAFADGLLRGNGYAARWFLKPCKVAVHDHKATYLLSVRGLETLPNYAGIADVSLSSDALAYCLKHLWGGATTRINGRYQVPKGGTFDKWRWYFQISELNNHGERFDWGYLAGALWTRLSKKLRRDGFSQTLIIKVSSPSSVAGSSFLRSR